MSYQEFLEFDNDKFAKIEAFCEKIGSYRNNCIFDDFPVELMKEILKLNFEGRKIAYFANFGRELRNFIVSNWDNETYKVEMTDLKNHLIETSKFTKDELQDILKNKTNPRYNPDRNYIYYSWWLYYYLPLFENGEEMILNILQNSYLDDAEDYLMDGIQELFTKERLEKFLPKFLNCLEYKSFMAPNKPCFYIGQQYLINFAKLVGDKIFDDPELKQYWKDYGSIEELKIEMKRQLEEMR